MRTVPVQWLARALGGEVEARLNPVLAFTFLYALSFSTFWTYAGIFAVKGLGARPSQVGLMFLLAAPPAGGGELPRRRPLRSGDCS